MRRLVIILYFHSIKNTLTAYFVSIHSIRRTGLTEGKKKRKLLTLFCGQN